MQQPGRTPFTILFAQFFDKFNRPKVQWLSRHIGHISGFVFSQPFWHSKKIFNDDFVTTRVDFGVAFSIKFLSSWEFLGFWKALEQDAMTSSVSKRNIQNTCEIWFCILISYLIFFLCANFQCSQKYNIVMNSIASVAWWHTLFQECLYLKPLNLKIAAHVLSGLKPLSFASRF